MKIEILTTVISICLVASSAQALDTEPHHPLLARQHEVSLNVGVLSALGEIGIAYAYSPVPWLALEAGVGYGASGIQLSGMVKPSVGLGSGPHRLIIGGVGVSAGVAKPDTNGGFMLFTSYDLADDTTFVWLNIDALGYTRRFSNGMFISMAGGVTIGLSGEYRTLDEPQNGNIVTSTQSTLGLVAPQARFALGYCF